MAKKEADFTHSRTKHGEPATFACLLHADSGQETVPMALVQGPVGLPMALPMCPWMLPNTASMVTDL